MSSENPIAPLNVIIADDHALFVDALSLALGAQEELAVRVSGTAANGAELLGLLKRSTPDLVLLDLNMPVMNGLEALPLIREAFPALPVIVITQYRDPKIVRECLQDHGAAGYVLKTSPFEELIEGIRHVLQGLSFMSRDLQLYPRDGQEEEKPDALFDEGFVSRYNLTRREVEILTLVAQAKSNSEIADILFISRQTVLAHRKNIMRKLNIATTPALVRFAIQHQPGG